MTWTVPTIDPVSSSAEITRAHRGATPAAAPRQNVSALARDIGSMKLTDAPPSTQSISTSLRPLDLAIAVVLQTANPDGARHAHLLGARERSLANDHEISRRLARAVAKSRLAR